jgi:hypothetical protein
MAIHGAPARLWRAGARVSSPARILAAIGMFFAAVLPAQQPAREGQDLGVVLGRLTGPDLPRLPAASEFKKGDRTIAATEKVAGTVAVNDGTVHVFGSVNGDVVTFNGDIIVHGKAEVSGNVIAIGGRVQADSGFVAGQTLMLTGSIDSNAAPPASGKEKVLHQLALAGGWLAILLVIAVGVLVLASENLSAVADALERHYGTALVAGVAGQLAALPLLVALTVALILTILGILLVPFAGVAYVIVCAGLVMLGFLATALVIGRGWRSASAGSDKARRAATLRALGLGLIVLLSPWFAAALLAPWPAAESLARIVAFGCTWVACTAGLGAAIISRAGIKQAGSSQAERAMASPSWQTPTPVAGVVAARRPSSSTSTASVK